MRARRVTSPAWLILATALALAATGCVRRAPEIRGRVVDARTGEPIEGALIVRQLYREPRFNPVDTEAVIPLEQTIKQARSDAKGSFALPGEDVSRLAGMAWAVYKPGWMPAGACYRGEPDWSRLGDCGGASPRFSDIQKDPWTSFTSVTKSGVLELEVRLHPPTVEGITWPRATTWYEYNPATHKHDLEKHFPEDVDPWGEYFRRLNILSRYDWLPREVFIDEAVGYVERGGDITALVRNEIGSALRYLDLDLIKRVEVGCGPARMTPCPLEFRTRVLSRRLLLETTQDLTAGLVEKVLDRFEREEDVTREIREEVVAAAYYDCSRNLPNPSPAARGLLAAERERCIGSRATCSSRYVEWLERELKR